MRWDCGLVCRSGIVRRWLVSSCTAPGSEHECEGLLNGAYFKGDIVFVELIGCAGIILVKLPGGFLAVFQHDDIDGFQMQQIEGSLAFYQQGAVAPISARFSAFWPWVSRTYAFPSSYLGGSARCRGRI